MTKKQTLEYTWTCDECGAEETSASEEKPPQWRSYAIFDMIPHHVPNREIDLCQLDWPGFETGLPGKHHNEGETE